MHNTLYYPYLFNYPKKIKWSYEQYFDQRFWKPFKHIFRKGSLLFLKESSDTSNLTKSKTTSKITQNLE